MLTKQEATARAEKALDAFNRMTPSLSSYASGILGRRIRVVAGPQTETDGKEIRIRPPAALARPQDHDRALCGLRDTDDLLLCDACATREEIMSGLHHEIAHIAHGSFDKQDRYRFRKTAEKVRQFLPEHFDQADYVSNYGKPMDTLHYSHKIHRHLSFMNQALEDHRINTESYKLRPGLEPAMVANSAKIIREGVPLDDGTFSKWGDRHRDSQMMIAPLFTLEGHDLRGNLDDDVVDAVLSAESQDVLKRAVSSRGPWHTLDLSVELLSVYRAKGFFQVGKDENSMTPEEEAEWDRIMQELSEILKAIFGHSDQGYDVIYEAPGAHDPRAEGDQVDREMARVVEMKEYFDDIPGNLEGVKIFGPNEGPCFNGRSGYNVVNHASEMILGKSVSKGRLALQKNARANLHRNQKAGRIDSGSLGKRAWNDKDGRLFKTKHVPDKRDYEVLIGFDISGSTSSRGRLQLIKDSVVAMAEFCKRLGIKFSVFAHTTQMYDMHIYKVKDVKEAWGEKHLDLMRKLGSGSSNMDGHTLEFYRKQLDKSRATDKIIMYITDGVMPGMNQSEEVPVLKREIEECKRRGYTLLALGVFTDAPVQHGLPTVVVNSELDYPAVVDHLAKRIASP